MKPLVKLSLLLLYIFSSITTAASTLEVIEITHPEFSQPLKFNVTLPAGYAKNLDKSYPMMFDFHPNAISYLDGMHQWMSHNGEWPWLQTIIVTPTPGNRVGILFDETGKTTPLLDFFDQQLFTTIDKKYRTNGYRIMSGFRTNATIVLSGLLNKPHMANAYIATSPEIKDDYAAILSTANKKLSNLNDKPRFLLFSHGTNIKEEHQVAAYKNLRKIIQSSAPSLLEWHYKHFNDHYFMSLPPLATIFAIEKIFDDIHQGLAPTSAISQQGVSAIIAHFDYLSKQKYGFKVSPKNSIDNLGFYLLNYQQEKGIAVFQKRIEMYADDAYSHHNLAKAYAQLGNYSLAVKYQNEAVVIADNMSTWHKKRHRKFLKQYQAKLKNSAL